VIAHQLSAGPVANELAAVVRRVNKELAAINGADPEIPALKEAFVQLDRSLAAALVAGDDGRAREVVKTYEQAALAAIEGAK
jgi:hypothetical protein